MNKATAYLNEELGDLVVNLHVGEDRGTIVRDVDVSVGGDQNLVQTSRAQRRLDDVGHGAGGENVALCGQLAVTSPKSAEYIHG